MRWFDSYNAIVFDCDGVILNSNFIKIEVMHKALRMLFDNEDEIEECIDFFSSNFGLSRFKHVQYFFSDILSVVEQNEDDLKSRLLNLYSFGCELLYPRASVTPGFKDFIETINVDCYVASGSEQNQLRQALSNHSFSEKFRDILGSPTSKFENLNIIKESNNSSNLLLIGDSVQDYLAATEANIDFVAYTPFSADKESLLRCCKKNNIPMLDSWNVSV